MYYTYVLRIIYRQILSRCLCECSYKAKPLCNIGSKRKICFRGTIKASNAFQARLRQFRGILEFFHSTYSLRYPVHIFLSFLMFTPTIFSIVLLLLLLLPLFFSPLFSPLSSCFTTLKSCLTNAHANASLSCFCHLYNIHLYVLLYMNIYIYVCVCGVLKHLRLGINRGVAAISYEKYIHKNAFQ